MTGTLREVTQTTPIQPTSQSPVSLRQRWLALRDRQPGLRIRNAADMLGVSEVELLATDCGNHVTRLDLDPCDLLAELSGCGPLMALVRNNAAVHETTGVFGRLQGKGHVRMFLGEQDQRLFVRGWTRAFAVQDDIRESVQFFNDRGQACFKLFTTGRTNLPAWRRRVSQYVSDDQTPTETDIAPPPNRQYRAALNTEQLHSFRQKWDAITDVHQFHGLLKTFGLQRHAALELAGPERASPVQPSAVASLLEGAQRQRVPLMTFVSNGDAVQIHTAIPGKLLRTGPWFNILDPSFNLHLNTEAVTSVWVIRRPSRDGIITSVEAFDVRQQSIVQFFGARREGEPENLQWRQLAEELPHATDQ